MKLLALLLSAIFYTPFAFSDTDSQRIVVDKEHIQMGMSGKIYSIESSEALILDATQYDYTSFSPILVGLPNTAKLIVDGLEHSFYWENSQGEYLLNENSLVSEPSLFEGFKSGKEVVVALGQSHRGIGPFKVYWVGKLSVK
ncbi:hypothetical protein FXE63_14125 [Vibrio mimicus]|uniref:hypothetical protein n=1 Tax=Vibrio mimicus TaxID=674 RepID=UPI0011D990EF|nr:hypothetical protein [Vibrio mimicus]TXZ06907.1 hypothetical protein FXE63_14125 [Vibrio mimicus]